MTLRMRDSYEKQRRPFRLFRRGRLADFPLPVYHDMDEFGRKINTLLERVGIDDLNELLNIDLSSLFPGSGGNIPGPGGGSGQTKTVEKTYSLVAGAAFAAAPSSERVTVANPFRIKSWAWTFQSTTGSGTVSVAPRLFIGVSLSGTVTEANVFRLTGSSFAFQHGVPSTFNHRMVFGNESVVKPEDGKLFDGFGNDLTLKATGVSSSPNSKVAAQVTVLEEVPV